MDNKPAELKTRQVGEKVKLHLPFEKSTVKELEGGGGIFEAVITTSGQDRHGEQIITEGIETDNYMEKNAIVLYGHDYWGLPIGKTLSLTRQKNKIKAKFQLAVEEYDFAGTVGKLIAGGYLNTVSIGGIVKKWSEDFRTILEMEMIEFSVVPVPANADAIITGRSLEAAAGKSLAEVSKEFEEFSQASMLDRVKNLGQDEVKSAISVLKNLVAALEESADAHASAGHSQNGAVRRIKSYRLLENAKAVSTEAQRVIRIIKIKE